MPIDDSSLPEPDQVMALLRARRSVRAFQENAVESALIRQIIDGANDAPSPHNAHRIEYAVVQEPAVLRSVLEFVAGFNGKLVFLLNNPAALANVPAPVRERVEAARPQLPVAEGIARRIKAGDDILQRGTPSLLVLHGPKAPDDFWSPRIDAGIAMQNAALVACSLGLGSCELGYVEIAADRDPQIQKLLGIPGDHAIYGVLAVGYPKYRFEKWIEKPPAAVTWK